jgi:hypothetical protein
MPTVTINRTDGPPATFDPANTLRVTRGLLSPQGGTPPATEIDIADPEPIIHSDQSMAAIVQLLGPTAKLVKLTAPDGSPVWVNAKKVTDIQPTTPDDTGGVPGPIPVDPINAQTKFFVGSLLQMVQEAPTVVTQKVAQAAA